MPVIHVEMFSGREAETKKQLVEKLTETYIEICGGRPEAVHIILKDVDKSNWAVGGELCSERYPG